MATKARTAAGTRIYIADGLPATFDQAGYEALSFIEIGEITDIPEHGKEYTIQNHNPLADRKTYKFKGSFNEGSVALQYAVALGVDGDAGQDLLFTALDDDDGYAFKIELNDDPDDGANSGPTTRFFPAKVASATENIGTVDNIVIGTTNLEIDGDIIKVQAINHA